MKLGWSVPARLLRWVLGCLVNAAVPYVLTGRRDLPWVWATVVVGCLLTLPPILTIDPELLRERRKPGPGARDRVSVRLLMALYLVQIVFAFLDVGRLHWSDTVPAGLHVLGLALNVAGFAVILSAIRVNRFFSSVVRIQTDRGHQLITTGPYGIVRHPGYLGMLLAYPTASLAIGSWWAFVPGVLCAFVVLRRCALEDAYLTANLAGYPAYRERVRSRLIPGAW
ncbi:MAG TPA: isoprenylcysteine carboxylmethyltransferase family protein [Gemmatimonadales bacterium]